MSKRNVLSLLTMKDAIEKIERYDLDKENPS
jgi:hypothetical protein